ncbi:MAG TPA: VWA domain-containing protein [Candidatus Acidoferrales bacterium]|nr:VWA domain-containing protein [Candidatus Acidoferrales bacterium]
MQNKLAIRLGLPAAAVACLLAAHSGASRPAPQGNPPGSAGQPAAPPPQNPAPPPPPSPATPPAPAAVAQAQRPAPTPLQATTRLVQVAVIAHKKGVPVADLTEEDFRVFDNGQEQKVQFFVKEAAGLTPANLAPLPANTFSNRPHSRAGIPANVTIILYDGLNTRVTDQGYARDKLVEFLSHLHPEDRVALYALGKNLRVLHDFTSDASSLLRVLSKYKGYNGPEVSVSDPAVPNEYDVGAGMSDSAQAGAAAVNEFLRGQDEVFSQFQIVNQAEKTVDALEAIAAHVAGIPGRKNLIWISGAFPFTLGYDTVTASARANGPEFQQRDFSEDLQRAARALADANVAVYPVDAHGLVINISSATRNPQPYRRGFYDATPSLSENDLTLQTMDVLAARTGGRAFYRTNDFATAIRTAIDDSQITYTLAYAPSHNDWNGKFRPIKVTTTRPGVELRYRTGYFAVPDKPLAPTESQRMAAEAEWSSLEATEIGMSVRAVRATLEGKPMVSFTLVVDSAGLRFEEEAGRHVTNILLLLVQKAEDGRVVHGASQTLALRLKDDTYQTAMAKGLRVTAAVEMDPAATNLRMVILDNSTGRLGSVDIPMAALAEAPAVAPSPAQPAGTPAPAPPAAVPDKPKP